MVQYETEERFLRVISHDLSLTNLVLQVHTARVTGAYLDLHPQLG
jgi:hypothetical protein